MILAALLTIQGTVRDTDGTPLPGVTVFIERTQTSVVTDAGSAFEISPETEPLKLQVFLGGFEPVTLDATPRAKLDVKPR